ncbi:MAG: hypothetical protein UZ15_CFX003002958 [Chloroflexi bacterium OLB15]|nr:MAG: hypothetical protein UZ15_CFX003002958 [Chloroflexi bacterium OLB15]
MSELVVLAFEDIGTAEKARESLDALESGEVIGLNDLVVVERDEKGKVKLNQARRHAGTKIVGGTFWGMLIGLLFLVPALGAIAGAVVGAAVSYFHDFGIPDDFIHEVGDALHPNSSALFMWVAGNTDPGQILARLKDFNGRIIRTSLSTEQEDRLKLMYGESDS